MADKKANTALAKVAIAGSEIALKCEISQQDIVAITVSKAEEELVRRRKGLERDKKELSKEIEELHKKRLTEFDKSTAEKAKECEKFLAPAFKKCGIEIKVKPYENRHNTFNEELEAGVFVGKKSGRGNDMHFKVKVKPTAEFKKISKDLTSAKKRMTSVIEELEEVYRDIQELPRKERQAKARLATAILKQTPEGRAILAGLEG